MKKKQFAVLLAAGMAAAAGAQAQTSVNFYGLVDAYVGALNNSNGVRGANGQATPGTKGRQYVVNPSGMTTSYFGMNGTEDLGGGLKAVFALETFFRNDTGAFGRFGNGPDLGFTRNAFVGLAHSSFGQITLGRNTSPYFLSSILFNPFVDSFVFSPTIAHIWRGDNNSQGIVQGDTGLSNAIRYTSPTFGGLRADVVYSANSSTILAQEDPVARKFGRAVDAALFYGRGPLSATLVYRTINLQDGQPLATARKQNSWLAGAAYDFNVVKLFGQYNETRDDYVAQADAKKKTWQLGVSVPAGPGKVLASYADSKYTQAGVASTKRDTWALGYDYSLSKRTDAYLAYYRDAMKDNVNNTQSVLGLGIRHRF